MTTNLNKHILAMEALDVKTMNRFSIYMHHV